MIEQLKALFNRQRLSRVVVIDDAFDEEPHPNDIDDARWSRFFDDYAKAFEDQLKEDFGRDKFESMAPLSLARDPAFLKLVWDSKDQDPAALELFSEFEDTQRGKLARIEPLKSLLQEKLSLDYVTSGSQDALDFGDADIVFLDLFLGYTENDTAIDRGIARVKKIIADRRARPPSVVLMSESPRLDSMGSRVRDDAEILGCQFRLLRKSELLDEVTMIERLYDLVVSRPDAMRLNEFILSWDRALENARVTFLKSIRSLDLSDYANMQALILEAEGDPVGDYIIDLFDMHLHNVLEGDDELERTANEINTIEWAEYPPAQFMPSPEVIEIMDGAIFYNKVRTGIENEGHAEFSNARLGDVFLGPEPPPQTATTESPPAASARQAYVVISQACDLLHGNADRLLLLKGRLLPYSWKQHALKAQPRTPIMIHNDNRCIPPQWAAFSKSREV